MEKSENAQHCFIDPEETVIKKLQDDIDELSELLMFQTYAITRLEREVDNLKNWTFNINKLD